MIEADHVAWDGIGRPGQGVALHILKLGQSAYSCVRSLSQAGKFRRQDGAECECKAFAPIELPFPAILAMSVIV